GGPAGDRCQQRLDAPAAPPRDAAVLPPGGNDRCADRLFRRKIPPTAGQRRRVRSSSAHRVRRRHVGIHRPPSRRGFNRLGARAPPRNPSTPTRRVHPGERRRRATAIPGGDPARLRTDGAIVAALLCLALGARLVPLTFSPLPFSIDGFALARISSNIAADGTWRIDPADTNSYNQKLPGFSILWSAAAQVGGLSPLVHVQLILPFLTCTTVLVAYLLGVKAAGRRLGGFVAGLFIALFGSFLAPAAFVLFLAVVVLLTALLASTARPAKSRIGRRLVSPMAKAVLPPVLGFALLLGNASTNLFVGTATTQPAFFQVLPAIMV